METTMRKEWGSPIGKVQDFSAQEFVAACVPDASLTPVPVDSTDYYKVDGIETNGTHTAAKLNGLYNTSEHVTVMKKLDKTWINHFFVEGEAKGYYYHIEKCYITLSTGYAQGDSYTTSGYFGAPVAVIHQTYKSGSGMSSFYLLSNEWKGDDIDSYMSSIKNNS